MLPYKTILLLILVILWWCGVLETCVKIDTDRLPKIQCCINFITLSILDSGRKSMKLNLLNAIYSCILILIIMCSIWNITFLSLLFIYWHHRCIDSVFCHTQHTYDSNVTSLGLFTGHQQARTYTNMWKKKCTVHITLRRRFLPLHFP
jgi:hypothetical protein